MLKKQVLDEIQRALIAFFKKNTHNESITLREIAAAIGVNHPQTVLNKLNQLVLKGYFAKDDVWYHLIRESIGDQRNDVIQLPIYGFAQCGNQGKKILDEYTQERIPVTPVMLGIKDPSRCFFVRAKWNSMEPKIQDSDLVLIQQQDNYDINDYVFVVHNDLPKLKKIIKQEDKRYLESVNRFFDKMEISKFDETKIVGVIKKVIKNF
jgi:repressor LexA